jgi:outer membrane protein assembly factor BamE (lipoprotein component of BamABCDE complex)
MNWKTIGMGLLVAGIVTGCSSDRSNARLYRSDEQQYYSNGIYQDRTVMTYADGNWAMLQSGMTKTQVANRIGIPAQKQYFSNGTEAWFYADGGQVHFNSRDRLRNWTQPTTATVTTYTTSRPYPQYTSSNYDRYAFYNY